MNMNDYQQAKEIAQLEFMDMYPDYELGADITTDEILFYEFVENRINELIPQIFIEKK